MVAVSDCFRNTWVIVTSIQWHSIGRTLVNNIENGMIALRAGTFNSLNDLAQWPPPDMSLPRLLASNHQGRMGTVRRPSNPIPNAGKYKVA